MGIFQAERMLTRDIAVGETSVRVEISPEASMLGEEPGYLSVNGEMVDGLTEPIWEWEQLNWH